MAPRRWDLEYDVVVAGYGYAGGMAAVAACDEGARVGLFEKMPHFGGNSILSGGSCAAGTEYEPTLAYLVRTCLGTTDLPILEAFAKGMVELPLFLAKLARAVGFETVVSRQGATYPFPGSEQMFSVRVTRNERYEGFPWAKGVKAGGTLFWVVAEHVQRRPEIDVHFNAPVRELITDANGAAIGVVVEMEQRRLRICARRAVVLCTGGFEHSARLLSHYAQIQQAVAMSPLGNTGDGILMAQKAGAALWHMWHLHGSYGFKVPGLPVAVRHNFPGYRDENRPMPWIVVDRFGRRFMDEYPPAPQDTSIRALECYDPDIQDYPRIPCYVIFDEEGRKLGPIAQPLINDERIDFEWSEDNLAEVERGYISRSNTVEELAGRLEIDPATLGETLDRWNDLCRLGRDPDFRRPPGTMVPIATPPFYSIPAWPIITNTQGGPVHDVRQQMLDPYGRPIPRLYKGGELGSIFGHLYLLAGNLSECFIGGPIAGRHAAAEPRWR